MRIVYYAHHHGSGHLRHAHRLQALGLAEVVVVGAPGSDHPLPPDVDPAHPHRQPAGSPFHWTPHDGAVRARFSAFHRALEEVDPHLVMVDVSVEAAVFAHLAGHRTAHRRMPGLRDDPAHRIAYASAERLFAYYPRELEQPGFGFAERTDWLGMPDEHPALPASLVEPGTVVVLLGAGGAGLDPRDLAAAAGATLTHQWHVLGPALPGQLPGNVHLHGWVDDPGPWLARAEVVVCGAGHNTVATVAGARRRVVLAPEPRPHDEQVVFARQLHDVLGVPVVDDWRAADWPAMLAGAADADLLASRLLCSMPEFTDRTADFLRRACS